MEPFDLNLFKSNVTQGLSPSSSDMLQARSEVTGFLATLSDAISRAMSQENSLYVESIDSTVQFDKLMQEIKKHILAMDPSGVGVSEKASLFNFALKSYLRKVDRFSQDFPDVLDNIDKLTKTLKMDITTMNIVHNNLENKVLELKQLEEILHEVYLIVDEASKSIDPQQTEAKNFVEERLKKSLESEKLNLAKCIVVTQQRIATTRLGIDHSTGVMNTLKGVKSATLGFMGVLINLVNIKHNQRVVFNYSGYTPMTTATSLEDEYKKVVGYIK